MANWKVFDDKGSFVGSVSEYTPGSDGSGIFLGIIVFICLAFIIVVWPIVLEDVSFSLFDSYGIWLLSFPITSFIVAFTQIFLSKKLSTKPFNIVISCLVTTLVTSIISIVLLDEPFWASLFVCAVMSVLPSVFATILLYLLYKGYRLIYNKQNQL